MPNGSAEILPMYGRYGMVEDWPQGKPVPPNPIQDRLTADMPMFVMDRTVVGGVTDRVREGAQAPILYGAKLGYPTFRTDGIVTGVFYNRKYSHFTPSGDFTATVGYVPFDAGLEAIMGLGTVGVGTVGWEIINDVNQDVAILWSQDGSTLNISNTNPGTTLTNRLQVVSMTYSVSAGIGAIMLNGALASYNVGPPVPVFQPNVFVGIGSDGGLASFFNGAFTYVCFHKKALTEVETKTLHNFIAQWGWGGGRQYALP